MPFSHNFKTQYEVLLCYTGHRHCQVKIYVITSSDSDLWLCAWNGQLHAQRKIFFTKYDIFTMSPSGLIRVHRRDTWRYRGRTV